LRQDLLSRLSVALSARLPHSRDARRRATRGGAVALAVLLAAVLTVWSFVWMRSVAPHPQSPVLMQPELPPMATSAAPIPVLPRPNPTSTPTQVLPTIRVATTRTPSTPPTRPAGHPTSAVPKKPTTEPAPPPAAVTATYWVGADWDGGFIGHVDVQSTAASAQTFVVTLRWNRDDGVRVSDAWNADLDRRRGTLTLSGQVQPGAKVNVGFDATKRTQDRVRPASCTVNGGACRIS
jgi:hypothetical protein